MMTLTHENSAQPVLVLGVGNILLSDEGAGVKAVEKLKEEFDFPPCVDIMDGGTIGIGLLSYLKERSTIVFIDAVKTGHNPGTVVAISDPPTYFQNHMSPHQIGILDLLALLAVTENPPPRTLLFGIEPKSIDTGIGLSCEVEENLPKLVNSVVESLRTMGHEITPIKN